jgi:hypothetical protein
MVYDTGLEGSRVSVLSIRHIVGLCDVPLSSSEDPYSKRTIELSGGIKDSATMQSPDQRQTVARQSKGNTTVGETTAVSVFRQNGSASSGARIVGPRLNSRAASPPQTTIRSAKCENETPQPASALFGLSPSADADTSDRGWVNVWRGSYQPGRKASKAKTRRVNGRIR